MCNSKDNLCNVSFCVSYFIKIISTPLFIGSPTYFCGRRSLHTSFCAPYITGFVDDEGVDHIKEMVQENYNRIKEDVRRIVADELERIAADPNLRHLLELNK